MFCVSSGFRCSLLFLALLVASQTFAKPGNSANSTPVSSAGTKHCNNVYNSFYAGTNKKIETIIQEMKKQLSHVEDDIKIIKENKTMVKEPNKTETETILQEMKKQLTQVQADINILKGNKTYVKDPNKKIEIILQEMKKQLTQMQNDINILKGNRTLAKTKKNCAELYKSGIKISGVYTIDPDGSGAFDVFCDQTTAGGGWTVFQKRLDGSVDFYRGWANYKRGFGNLTGEFWLGLDKIHRLTKTESKLRVDLEDNTGGTAYAEYDMFAVTSERTKYKLSLRTYSGNAGDSLSYARGQAFTTKDQDNDSAGSNCAVLYKGAWWYKACLIQGACLNGLYHHGKHSRGAEGVNWYHWKGLYYSAKRAEMKIRPVHF